MANQLDDAFNWLVVILGVIAGALTQFPEMLGFGFYLMPDQASQGGYPSNVEYTLLRLLIFPVVLLVLFWLCGFLVVRSEWQVALKFFSWVLASIILTVDLIVLGPLTLIRAYFPPTFWSTWNPETGPPGVILITALLTYAFLVAFPILFSFRLVRPRMMETYKDSKLLNSRLRQVLLFVMAVLVYVLAIGFFETPPS